MLIHSKRWCVFFIVLGAVIALGNAYLFLIERTAWQGIMFLVGIAWIWTGWSNVRRLQNTGSQ